MQDIVKLDDIETTEVISETSSVESSKPISLTERKVSLMYADGNSHRTISDTLGIPVQTVKNILSREHIRDFVGNLIKDQYTTLKEGRLRVLNKIIDDKIAKLEEESGGDLAGSTKKDIVDLMVIMDNMLKEREKAELGTTQDTYIQVIQQVLKD